MLQKSEKPGLEEFENTQDDLESSSSLRMRAVDFFVKSSGHDCFPAETTIWPNKPMEVEGIMNTAASRGPDLQVCLFLRLAAKGNYSNISMARIKFNRAIDPAAVARLDPPEAKPSALQIENSKP